MRIYLKNIDLKFHPDPIWNDGDFSRFLKRVTQQEEQQQIDE